MTDVELSLTGCAPQPESGAKHSWREPGWEQTDDHPVVCVSRNDAMRYAAWMSGQAGASLRLPTEAEFEYTLRAGEQTRWPWGVDGEQGCLHGNIGDVNFKRYRPAITSTGAFDELFTFTSPVGMFAADKYGIKDLSGNVLEWSTDCFEDTYANARTDGTASTAGSCTTGVLRGASFDDGPRYQRSANRVQAAPSRGAWVFGIRLAQDL